MEELTCLGGMCLHQPKGSLGQECFADDTCNGSLECVADSCVEPSCTKPCGKLGEGCCEGLKELDECSGDDVSCQYGVCKSCGGDYELCCADGTCSGESSMCVEGMCGPCGGAGQVCGPSCKCAD